MLEQSLEQAIVKAALRIEKGFYPSHITNPGPALPPVQSTGMTPWEPGTQLGPYKLLAPIGAGGMGEVWKAIDSRLTRVVAIKRFKAPHKGRFDREARSIAALNHPHVCQIYDVGPDYLVLEYIEGQPLPCPIAPDEVVSVALIIACAIEVAHTKGIIHRDLKPANILMTRDRSVKLLDFGLAKLMEDAGEGTVTLDGSVLGTPAYMSPEQAAGKPIDERSDVFSFGAVLYEMLSGNRAFSGGTAVQVLHSVLHHEPAPIQALPALERVVRLCLAKRPEERFQSMPEVRKALEAIPVARAEPHPSIAVLPFTTMSSDKADEYFSDGLTEEIIYALAHVSGLNVIARTSSFSFRGKDVDVRKVAEALGVQTILEGSVRRSGGRIRVTTQLINAANGYHLWSERYDREMAEVFTIQDEIAQAIASALQAKLSSDPAAARRHTPGIPAYEALLKGRHFLRKGTPESYRHGKECLEQAITLDPDFALAHAELAACYRLLASLGDAPTREALVQARAAALRSLRIDPALPEAHAQAAAVSIFLDYDWRTAGHHLQLAMAIKPIPSEVSHIYSFFYLMPLGRMQEAMVEMERSIREDPLNLECLSQYAALHWAAGKYDEAVMYCSKALELDRDYWLALFINALWHAQMGSVKTGLELAERAYAVMPKSSLSVGLLAGFRWRTGEIQQAEQMVEALGDGTDFGTQIAFSVYYSIRLDFDKAADWTEKAIEQRDPNALPSTCGPYRQYYVANGRWPVLARMLHLPETATSARAVHS